MKWLIGCLVALVMVSSAFAGEDPYIAVVGNDIAANQFYLSPKYVQFLYDQTIFAIPTTGEGFTAQNPVIQPEICDTLGDGAGPFGNQPPFVFRGNPNARVTAGNAGFYQWTIRLPKKPVGEINLCFQCGVIKPNTFADLAFAAVQYCAAETGERIGDGFCSHQFVEPGIEPIVPAALPKITASASAGPYNVFTGSFNLTAYKNPGLYTLFPDNTAIQNNASSWILDGTNNTRVLLKSCMDKCVVVKLPVEGQINALGQTERDLVEGDLLTVRMSIPRQNTVDIYCHAQSLRLMGIGESPF